jgi:hypothetical protein
MLIDIKATDGGLSEKFAKLPANVEARLLQTEKEIGTRLLGIVQSKAGGDVLKVRTGKYLGSFSTTTRRTGTGILTKVSTKDPLAHILEYGANIPAHLITTAKVRALHFLDGSYDVFAKVVHSPGGRIEPRSVMHSTFLEQKESVVDQLVAAAREGFNEGK